MEFARKIIIDTDPGQDDAVAILMALGSPEELDVQGIVTVAGNVPLSRTTDNARQILELAQRADIPLHAGCARPMRRKLATAEHVHGRDRARRPVAAGADDEGPRAARRAFHGRRAARGEAGRDHAGDARPAHQHCHGDGPRARYRRAHRGNRDDVRCVFRGRQHHAGGRVQQLRRPGGRGRRPHQRRQDHDGPVGRDASVPEHADRACRPFATSATPAASRRARC